MILINWLIRRRLAKKTVINPDEEYSHGDFTPEEIESVPPPELDPVGQEDDE